MKDFDQLSERQQNILLYMDRYIAENGFPPTIRDIGSATSIASTSVVNYNLNKLVDAGFLEREESKSRGLRLVRELPNGNQSGMRAAVRAGAELAHVRMWGHIVASEPVNIEPDEDPENTVDVPPYLLSGVDVKEVFALKVKGNSMIDAMIQDGDIVILRHTNTANRGDMVAVWLTDRSETTLKHFFPEGDKIRLQPAHPTMDPIYVDAENCQVQGRVLSVMRQVGR